MTRFGYVVRPKADRDIDDIADDLTERAGLDTGLRFLSEVYEIFALIASQPEMGWQCRISHPKLKMARTFRLSERFENYLIFYHPHQAGIEIMRVIHGSQDIEALFGKGDAFD